MTDSKPTENQSTLKYVSLIILTLQNAILGLSMRYAATRTAKEDQFFSSTGEKFGSALITLIMNINHNEIATNLDLAKYPRFSDFYERSHQISDMLVTLILRTKGEYM